jgi:hypothetical protein
MHTVKSKPEQSNFSQKKTESFLNCTLATQLKLLEKDNKQVEKGMYLQEI